MGFLIRIRPIITPLLSLLLLSLHQTAVSQFSSNGSTTITATSRGSKAAARGCNIFRGKWVYDSSYPLYSPKCPFIEKQFNCINTGRPDWKYLKYRWQPDSCNLRRFNGFHFLRKWRGKKIMFVGDSLSANQFESLTCMILAGAPNVSYTTSSKPAIRSVTFQESGLVVMLYRTPYLVDMVKKKNVRGAVLMLDSIQNGNNWKNMDVLVFNSWHWWTHNKTAQPWTSVQEGKKTYTDMNRMVAYYIGLTTWARWVNANVDPSKTKVFFQGISPTHYMGKEWNKPTQSCAGQKMPFSGPRYPAGMTMASVVVNKVLSRIKKPVTLLDITTLSQYRLDAHPSYFNGEHSTLDCSHWCLPGLPDTWNELLYQYLR